MFTADSQFFRDPDNCALLNRACVNHPASIQAPALIWWYGLA